MTLGDTPMMNKDANTPLNQNIQVMSIVAEKVSWSVASMFQANQTTSAMSGDNNTSTKTGEGKVYD